MNQLTPLELAAKQLEKDEFGLYINHPMYAETRANIVVSLIFQDALKQKRKPSLLARILKVFKPVKL